MGDRDKLCSDELARRAVYLHFGSQGSGAGPGKKQFTLQVTSAEFCLRFSRGASRGLGGTGPKLHLSASFVEQMTMMWWLLLFILLIGNVPYHFGRVAPLFLSCFLSFFSSNIFSLPEKKC